MPHPVTASWETLSGLHLSTPTERLAPSDLHVPANNSASGRISSRGTGGRVSQLTAITAISDRIKALEEQLEQEELPESPPTALQSQRLLLRMEHDSTTSTAASSLAPLAR